MAPAAVDEFVGLDIGKREHHAVAPDRGGKGRIHASPPLFSFPGVVPRPIASGSDTRADEHYDRGSTRSNAHRHRRVDRGRRVGLRGDDPRPPQRDRLALYALRLLLGVSGREQVQWAGDDAERRNVGLVHARGEADHRGGEHVAMAAGYGEVPCGLGPYGGGWPWRECPTDRPHYAESQTALRRAGALVLRR